MSKSKSKSKSKRRVRDSDSDGDSGSDSDSDMYQESDTDADNNNDSNNDDKKDNDSDSGDDDDDINTADRGGELGPQILPNKTNRAHQPLKSNTVLEEDPRLLIPEIPNRESVSESADLVLPVPLVVVSELGSSIPETPTESGLLIPETEKEVESGGDLGSSIPEIVDAERNHGSLIPEPEPSIPQSAVSTILTSELEHNFPDPVPLIPLPLTADPVPLIPDPVPSIPDPVPLIPARIPMVIVRKAFIPLRPKKGPGARGGHLTGPNPDLGP